MTYLDELSEIWEAVKLSFRDRYAQAIIDLWFGELKIHSFENNIITLSTTSSIKHKIVNERYLNDIRDGFSAQFGFESEIRLIFVGEPVSTTELIKQVTSTDEPQQSSVQKEPEAVATETETPAPSQNYKFEYTFDNFIVGGSNQFAHAACQAVAARPASDYNPLFIYGPSGLGKTHLMSAVVNEIKQKKPDVRVMFIKGDALTNQMIESLAKHEMHKFRERFRNCDILLIDDIQFIAGKTSTQEEFFHTFNALYDEGKQIILSSDRPPKDIPDLESRLVSRFEWGLIADIQPPDLELRIAIIKKKAEQVHIEIPDEVLTFLAENLRSNIRQIEGAIKKLSALSFLSGKSVSMDLAKGCLSALLGSAEPVNVTVEKIFSAVQSKYNVSKSELVGKKKTKEIAAARHITVFLIREITDISFPSIGKIIGRDYATVHYSYEQISKKYQFDSLFKIEMDELMKEITG
ncbi:MAG: chromosomal replication initiator protein DnaA [Clostridia bacterium]|nr:chromosomal replication initiator protein DnaA [Clostridia bacterium]